jgi:tRNA(His) guanylyltransferase
MNTDNKSQGPSLTDRMKGYEDVTRDYFPKRSPIIIRLDGCSFSTWTKNLNRPFDPRMSMMMQKTVKALVNRVQGCVFAFSQSDEISLFLRDYDTLTTESWFGSNRQKMVSVSASMATAHFNEEASKMGLPLAYFDSRAFLLPKEEVVNYFIYRQHDGLRNSVSMQATSVFGHKACHGKKIPELKQMLVDNGTPWEDLDAVYRHGFAIRKDESEITTQLPLFKDDRSYVEELVYVKPQQ